MKIRCFGDLQKPWHYLVSKAAIVEEYLLAKPLRRSYVDSMLVEVVELAVWPANFSSMNLMKSK